MVIKIKRFYNILQFFIVKRIFTNMAKIQLQSFMQRIGISTQTELAELLGLTQGAISSWNSGVRTPPYETCAKLLSMGMTVEELFGTEVFEEMEKKSAPRTTDSEFVEKVKRALLQIASK